MSTTSQSPIATGLASYVPPLAERALDGQGIEMLHAIARLLTTVGGTATTEGLRRRYPLRLTETLMGLENAGFIDMRMSLANRGQITMTAAGWAKVRGGA